MTVSNAADAEAAANNVGRRSIFRNCDPFSECKTETNNTEIDDGEDIDIVKPMYNLIEYGDNYSKTSGGLWQYGKDIPAKNSDLVDFNEANVSDSFSFKENITGQAGDNGTKDVEMMVLLK